MAKPAKKHLKIFLSSPGDVADEREIAVKVIEALGKRPSYRGKVELECVRWDDPNVALPMGSRHAPQPYVDEWIGTADRCDLTLVILWSRLGTEFEDENGVEHASGTMKEFNDALKGQTDPWVFAKNQPPQIKPADPHYDELNAEYQRLRDVLYGPNATIHPNNRYETLEEFERELASKLEEWLAKQLVETASSRKAYAWENNNTALIRDIEQKQLALFNHRNDGEPVTLQKLYIPVRAWYVENEEQLNRATEMIGVDAEAEVRRWLKSRDAAAIQFMGLAYLRVSVQRFAHLRNTFKRFSVGL